ncbi:MAG: TIGR03087 family PEP-CTERM/XrtA system glycosyltransferase [Sphingomonas sp.]
MGDILFLAHRIPYPPDRGDKIRSFNILKFLAERATVHLAAFVDEACDRGREDDLAPFTADRAIIWRGISKPVAALKALASGRPASLTAFDSAVMHLAVAKIFEQRSIDCVYIFSSQMAQYVPADCRARIIMDFCDMDSAKFATYAESARGPLRWMMRREGRLLLAHEAQVAARADASLFVSAAEAALFTAAAGAGCVHVVENGIDTALFDPRAAFERPATEHPLVVFTGQMDYPPNVDAVSWFANDVMPLVRCRHSDARFAVVGRNPSETVRALAALPGVLVTGEVSDVRGWLAAADVVVAPLRIARGIQNKVLEAMAMARPVVASGAAAEGIDHRGTLLVADGAEAMAAAVGSLLDDYQRAQALGNSARAQVIERYGWAARLAVLDALMGLTAPVDKSRSAA